MTDPHRPRETTEPESPPVYRAVDLTLGGKRAYILLGDQTYSLSITRAGKLILTK
ncbi:MAG: hemin uptake protein HemP [Pseudomonadota bacterium]